MRQGILIGMFVALLLAGCSGDGGAGRYGAPQSPDGAAGPGVTVADQSAEAGRVVIDEIDAEGPSWIVIHTDSNGGPGPVIGYAAVPDGHSAEVAVEIDPAAATPVLYAMLHTDAGVQGSYEFPGADVPVAGDRATVPFNVSLPAAEPSVSVRDQPIVDGSVTIESVVAAEPGWLVIHSEANGGPGPVIGYAPVTTGTNARVVVAIEAAAATPALYAMLHTDAGVQGSYEFPGEDVPVPGERTNPRFNLSLSDGPTVEVSMSGFSFSPANLVIRAGTAVRWTNFDSAPHSSTGDDGLWDSGLFEQEGSFAFTFDAPGVYAYHCRAHGGPGGDGMSGQVTVIP